MTETPAAAPALAAFLRGVERRGAAFAELQCGDAVAGDAALAVALRAFRNHAAVLPMAEWPRRFWSLLAASPPLRRDATDAYWPPSVQALAAIDPASRASLLLRLAAGLDEADAAAVQGIDAATYREALAAACPRDAEGQPDAAGWRALADAIQGQLRELSPERLARLRDAASVVPRAAPASAADRPAAPTPRRRGRAWRWLLLLLALCAAAALAWWRWWPHAGSITAWPAPVAEETGPLPTGVFALADAPPVATEELPPAEEPAARFDPAPAAPADDGEADAAIVAAADFHAWFAASLQQEATEPAEAAPASRDETAAPPEEPAIAPLKGTAVPDPADRAARRAAWDRLDDGERDRIRAAAAQFAALPPPRQQVLRARFDALDAMQQRGWRLGPTLGAQYADLHPLLAFVPPEQAAALPAALKSLDADQRAELAALAQRTPPQERDALRRELLASPPQGRGAWVQQRAQR
ncbi:MAG: hypothetical protein QM761_03350 [Pseudoxanthomonas sp.]